MVDIAVTLPPDPDAPARARRALEGLRSDLGDQTFEDAMLLVSELVTNSVRHAQLSPDLPISLRVRVDGMRVRIDVSDPGPGFSRAPSGARRSLERGWGLSLLDRLASRWGISEEGGTTIWFELLRTPSAS